MLKNKSPVSKLVVGLLAPELYLAAKSLTVPRLLATVFTFAIDPPTAFTFDISPAVVLMFVILPATIPILSLIIDMVLPILLPC